MALIYLDDDPWLKELENCEDLCGELAVRVETFRNGRGAGDASDIRIRMRQFDQQLTQLRSSLFSDDHRKNVTPEESERRERCLENLFNRAKHLRLQFTAPGSPSFKEDENRDVLFGDTSNTAKVREENEASLRQRQADILADQDRGLDVLSKIISRQKNIAQSIDNEVTTQSEIVTSLADNMGQVGLRTERATSRTTALITTENTCGYWLVASVLFVAIILVVIF